MKRVSGKKLTRRVRRAAVVVEMALVTPFLLAMIFGIIEFGWMFTVQHTMVNASREGARVGVLQGSDAADMEAQARAFLEPMGLSDTVAVDVTEATVGDPFVTVHLTVPRDQVSLIGDFFGFAGGMVEGTTTMRKEGM